jgi:hypothetical protein
MSDDVWNGLWVLVYMLRMPVILSGFFFSGCVWCIKQIKQYYQNEACNASRPRLG